MDLSPLSTDQKIRCWGWDAARNQVLNCPKAEDEKWEWGEKGRRRGKKHAVNSTLSFLILFWFSAVE